MKQPRDEEVYTAVLAGEQTIDDMGRIWRVAKRGWSRWELKSVTRPCRKVRAEHDTGDYLMARSMINGRRYQTGAHRLVFRHFNGPIPSGLTVNHINGKKKDNRPGNLELATYPQQAMHARHVLKVGHLDQNGERNSMAKLTALDIPLIRKRRAAGEKLNAIAADFNVSDRTISKVARGDRWASIG